MTILHWIIIALPGFFWFCWQLGKKSPKALFVLAPALGLCLFVSYGAGLLAGCERPWCVNLEARL